MSNTIRRNRNENRKRPTPFTRATNQKIATAVCECGALISAEEVICLNCEISSETFGPISNEELLALIKGIDAWEEEVAV